MSTLGAMDGLRVSELAERAGVAHSTVRFYERAGLLSPPRRAANGYRVLDITASQITLIAEAPGTPGLLDALFRASAPSDSAGR
jgi:hypothetical protein